MSQRGIFITFEGIDGSGKTTQMQRLGARLRSLGRSVVETVEPGGTRVGAQIRRILLDAANQDLRPMAELLLYFASRSQNVEEMILPGLEQGAIVLADRFTDSSVVYQGCGRGLGIETVLTLDRLACRGVVPDLTILVDIDLATSLGRARARNEAVQHNETRIDEEPDEFHRRVRDAYHDLARRESARYRMVDGSADPGTVERAIWGIVSPYV